MMRWLLRFGVVAALAAGGYLIFNRSGNMEPVPGGVITLPSQTGPRGGARPPFPTKPGDNQMPPGFKVTESKVVELNSATLAEVETIPGITPDYARRIVAGRPYRSMNDLARTGIPRSILDDISPPAVIRVPDSAMPNPSPQMYRVLKSPETLTRSIVISAGCAFRAAPHRIRTHRVMPNTPRLK